MNHPQTAVRHRARRARVTHNSKLLILNSQLLTPNRRTRLR